MLWTGCLFIILSSSVLASVPEVKVLIAKSLGSIEVNGTDLSQQIPIRGTSKVYAGTKTIQFNCKPNGNSAIFPNTPTLLASVSSPSGFINWGKKKYHGELRLITSKSQKSCDLINVIPMENYISTLLAKEMNSGWPLEALKAQAVAARSYALAKMKKDVLASGARSGGDLYHLESSEKDQVSGSFSDATVLTDRAAKETFGEVLSTKTGVMVEAYFHSKCGGKTLRPDQVWQNKVEGYSSVDCPFCHKTGKKTWKNQVSKFRFAYFLDEVLEKYYGERVKTNPQNLTVMVDDKDATLLKVYRGSKLHILKKAMFRTIAGRELLPSNLYALEDTGEQIEVHGDGYGHGVGLCQLGALELAKRGYKYSEILQYYFPELQVKKIY